MPIAHRVRLASLPPLAAAVLGACASIKIEQPPAASAPAPVKVAVAGSGSYWNLRVTANGMDVTSRLTSQPGNRNEGFVSLSPGTVTWNASATVACSFCAGGQTQSTDSRTFTVASSHTFVDIDAGDAHTCAVDTLGQALCWGLNSFGQLGTGAAPDQPCSLTAGQPQRPCRLDRALVDGGHTFRSVSAGDEHTCGLTAAGEILCWGRNHRGQLGNGTFHDSRSPVRVSFGGTFTAVSAGGSHTCALDDQNWVYCWGNNDSGQLGLPQSAYPCPGAFSCSATPVRQGTGIAGGQFIFFEVDAGARHTCASNRVNVKCWGDNGSGQLGTGPSGLGGPYASLSVSGQFTTYATASGTTLGPGFSAGGSHTCALLVQDPGADCWGANQLGQLGGGWPSASYPDPKPVATPGAVGRLMTGISGGALHTCALMQSPVGSNNVPACAGQNAYGQLGDGSRNGSRTFVRAFLRNAAQDFFHVTAGGRHSCALDVSGRATNAAGGSDYFGVAYCWGDNTYGQVGQNYESAWPEPMEVHF